jgi:hypothetical protein
MLCSNAAIKGMASFTYRVSLLSLAPLRSAVSQQMMSVVVLDNKRPLLESLAAAWVCAAPYVQLSRKAFDLELCLAHCDTCLPTQHAGVVCVCDLLAVLGTWACLP